MGDGVSSLVHNRFAKCVTTGRCDECGGMQMYAEMRAELAGGGRAFIVCPLVEASTIKSATRTNLELRAATEERDRLINEGALYAFILLGLCSGPLLSCEHS